MPADLVASESLIIATIEFLSRLAQPRRHHIACGLSLVGGATVFAINIVSNFGVASVCAEQVALGESLAAARSGIDLIVSVRATFRADRPYEIVAPCGRCRELLYEYAHGAQVAVPRKLSDGFELVDVTTLMPYPFVRRDVHAPPDG